MAERKLIVQVIGDDSGLQQTLQQSTKSIQKFGRDTSRATGTGSTISTAGTFGPTLDRIRENREEAEKLREKLSEVGDSAETSGQQIQRALKIGAGFFALGRGLEGAGKGLEAIQGHATSASHALEDAGGAVQSLITLDPGGFFEAVGAKAGRTRKALDEYGQGLKDANQATTALSIAAGASALGFDKQAAAIRRSVAQLKAAAAAEDALAFAQRKENVTTQDGQTRLVRFRGAGAAEREFGGAGGVELERTARQPIEVVVNIDGEAVGRTTRRSDDKNARRNPRQKRGPNSSFR